MSAQPIPPVPPSFRSVQFPKIGDYAVIGDCRSAALVSKHGSIDWLCWPRFDSPSIFAALLDRERGGSWSISPVGEYSVTRHYLPDTNTVQTEFVTPSGTAVLTDLMPVRENTSLVPDHEIIRQVECTSGEVKIDVVLAPRAKYGEAKPKLEQPGCLGLRFCHGRGVYWLRGSESLAVKDDSAILQHRLKSGEALLFSLSYTENAPAVLPDMNQIRHRMSVCADWWRKWVADMRYEGEFRDEVVRSALT